MVWCAAVARRHGDLATRWAERLPVRAGVDAGALVRAPSSQLAAALDRLGDLDDAGAALGVLVSTVLPWLGEIYGAHLETASPVREAPVAEVLVESRRNVVGETRSGRVRCAQFGCRDRTCCAGGGSGEGFRTGLRQGLRFPCRPLILTAPLHCLRSRETPGTGASCLKRARTRPADLLAMALLEG